jgi:hypothetical protein
MKTFSFYMISIIALLFAGCAALESPVGKAIFNIGVRSIAYEVAKASPNSVGAILEYSQFLGDLDAHLSPEAFNLATSKWIAGSSMDSFQKANVSEISTIVGDYYAKLHEQYASELPDSQAIAVLKAIGNAISFGVQPSVDGSAQFVLESASLVIVVD